MSDEIRAWSSQDWARFGVREICGKPDWNGNFRNFGSGPRYVKEGFWFTTRQEAIDDAERRRVELIAKAKRQLLRLENMKFE